MMMQLIWFRQDLRIEDHTALWHATNSGQTIALVILSPEQWKLHDDAPIKIDFYLRQLKALKRQLQKLNIPLIVQTIQLWQDVPQCISSLCESLNIENVHANIEAGFNERLRDENVEKQLHLNGKQVHFYHDRTIFSLGSIRNQSNLPYQVFGAFKKKCYEQLSISLPILFDTPNPQARIKLEELTSYSTVIPQIEDIYPDTVLSERKWKVSEAHTLELLDDFIENRLVHYHEQRDFPNIQGTSQLSAYLNMGIISIRQCLHALFREQLGHFLIQHQSQQTWLDELLWREFYQHILFDFPQVSKHCPFKPQTDKIQWRQDLDDLDAWKFGKTGIPIVDAGMRQMLSTGWMHNRVRMITAMFLSKNLLIDWRLGEQWFMQNLIDGDLAANNGGWQWCASTGTDAVPYFRIFNPISQSLKFDASGDYIRQWIPELAHLDHKTIHEPYAKQADLALDYPKPIVDLKQSRLRAIDAFKLI
ncbi:cryptochrome/photolyase family protein [Acinetobacter shaoyimingii]|uniref:Deoxyribodipyrimidine photo-lyase n=1 Tax=Acinetobacter shaoyimingii TaxID=2715164 RepID=A0A6G8RU78_9GAMM|nr:deoxyribodipyrimidine photo-lyase [Acinetobacter shaoyimingii]QIO05492.1 deoxyribodipyrimidine photo-lyase [Acinetobacter shaoyimingii]